MVYERWALLEEGIRRIVFICCPMEVTVLLISFFETQYLDSYVVVLNRLELELYCKINFLSILRLGHAD